MKIKAKKSLKKRKQISELERVQRTRFTVKNFSFFTRSTSLAKFFKLFSLFFNLLRCVYYVLIFFWLACKRDRKLDVTLNQLISQSKKKTKKKTEALFFNRIRKQKKNTRSKTFSTVTNMEMYKCCLPEQLLDSIFDVKFTSLMM